MDKEGYIQNLCREAKDAANIIMGLTTEKKNRVLLQIAHMLKERSNYLQEENAKDLQQGKEAGLDQATLDRLALTDKRIGEMAQCLVEIAALPDPVGEILNMKTRPNGMKVGRMRVPIGVIGIIYEARPNVTSDAAGLCFKSSNAIILRGGKEALHSNKAIVKIIRDVMIKESLPPACVQFIDTPDRELVPILLRQISTVDLIIPRGGKGLIETVVKHSHIPVIKHYDGICHIFVDKDVSYEQACRISVNSKVQRPSVCNALETILIHENIALEFLPLLAEELHKHDVELRGCKRAKAILDKEKISCRQATDEDWRTEYLDLILSIRIVDNIDQAIEHINTFGSHHTESILTDNYWKAKQFTELVDSACVFVNASTRLSDGHQFGLGAEIGISTDKLHARGPMGLEDLTTSKFIVIGENHIRE